MASRGAARGVTAAFDRYLRPNGVRITQFTVLATLLLRGPTPIGALARHIGVERTTLTRNVALLVEKGWARDEFDPADARSHVISATPAGEAVVHGAFKDWRKAQQKVAAILGASGVAAVKRASRLEFRA